MGYRLGIDVGGTFTDLALLDGASGRLVVGKVPSVPGDPSEGILTGITRILAEARGHARGGGLSRPRDHRLDEHAPPAQGGEDRARDHARVPGPPGDRPPAPPLALRPARAQAGPARGPAAARRGARAGHGGRARPDAARPRRGGSRARGSGGGAGIEALAICFLYAYLEPDHEREVLARARRRLPGVLLRRLARGAPGVPRVRAAQHDGGQRLPGPRDGGVHPGIPAPRPRARHPARPLHQPVERRDHRDRRGRASPREDRAIRAERRRGGSRAGSPRSSAHSR